MLGQTGGPADWVIYLVRTSLLEAITGDAPFFLLLRQYIY